MEEERQEEQKTYLINDDDFEFVVADNGEPSITADELFFDGRILPLFNGDDTRSERSASTSSSSEAAEAGEYCEWSPERCRKSASTGSVPRLRIRDFLAEMRNHSDGKKKFGFLETTTNPKPKANAADINKKASNSKDKKTVTELDMVTAHRLYYGKLGGGGAGGKGANGARRSFLPYRQELFGFSRTHQPF
ncbi:uncharacterized protein [Typha latifolia]|uniref:uncharacterized protein n=1 Tax=Typha latifolia TaxID=4733 RepID=UPI003C2E5D53